MNKKKILLVTTSMHVGGVTTALISFLSSIDYNKYDVDLLLYEDGDFMQKSIPDKVNVLPQARAHDSLSMKNLISKGVSISYIWGRSRAFIYEKILKREYLGLQIRSKIGANYSRKLTENYDIAISFMEFWPLNYVAFHVNANIKLAWIHMDYKGSKLSIDLDKEAFEKIDRIVLVSDQCLQNMRELNSDISKKAVCLPNLMSDELIRACAKAPCDVDIKEEGLRLVTVCRIEFSAKGLDRTVRIFTQLKNMGYSNYTWYIIGDGRDMDELKSLIFKSGLQNNIILLGQMLNPHPVVAKCDAFLLLSNYEGKPIVITESMMLGIPPYITDFASAEGVVANGINGAVCANNAIGIYEMLKDLLDSPKQLEPYKKILKASNYGNMNDIQKFYDLIEQIEVAKE